MNKKDYLKLVAKRKASQKLLELDMPTGAVWKYTPINIPQYAITGKLPLHILAGVKSLKSGMNAKQAAALESKLEGDDIIKIYAMVRDVMLNNVVEPKITLEETEDSITPEMIDPADFDFFTQFVISGGQATQNSFRKTDGQPRRSGASGVDSENAESVAVANS